MGLHSSQHRLSSTLCSLLHPSLRHYLPLCLLPRLHSPLFGAPSLLGSLRLSISLRPAILRLSSPLLAIPRIFVILLASLNLSPSLPDFSSPLLSSQPVSSLNLTSSPHSSRPRLSPPLLGSPFFRTLLVSFGLSVSILA